MLNEGRLDKALLHLPAIYVSNGNGRFLRNGRTISLEESGAEKEIAREKPYRAYEKDGCFIGLVKMEQGSDYWQPLKVLG